MKKTKIIATVWPATESEEKLIEMYESGVNIIRFNFSHATHEHSKIIADRVKKLNKEWLTNLSLLLDTKWPEIRTGILSEKISYEVWEKVKIYIDDSKRDEKWLFCDYPYLVEDLNIWDEIIIDSGLCKAKVLEKNADYLLTEFLNSCTLWSKRHINLPGVRLKLPGITDKDKEDVLFAIENDYDFIAMSFVRNKENIAELKDFLKEHNASHIKIISKVENEEAIENLEEIVKYSDWVMVARWDLWIEVPIEKLPFYQKQIVDLCLANGKFFVIATHLLETMIENPFPTRAEVSDIYNSVLANTDCTMLSWETTTGKYPIESVKMMTQVIQEAEKNRNITSINFSWENLGKKWNQKKILVKNALQIACDIEAKAFIIFTQYWFLPKMAAAFKPNINMYAFTNEEKTFRFLNVLFGINPIFLEKFSSDYEANLESAIELLKKKWILFSGEKIVMVWDTQKNWKEIPTIKIVEVE